MSFQSLATLSHVAFDFSCRKFPWGSASKLRTQLPSMAVPAPSSAPYLRGLRCNRTFSSKFRHHRLFPSKKSPFIVAMAPRKKVSNFHNFTYVPGKSVSSVFAFKENSHLDCFNLKPARIIHKHTSLFFRINFLSEIGSRICC